VHGRIGWKISELGAWGRWYDDKKGIFGCGNVQSSLRRKKGGKRNYWKDGEKYGRIAHTRGFPRDRMKR